jgi:hypothetical protein
MTLTAYDNNGKKRLAIDCDAGRCAAECVRVLPLRALWPVPAVDRRTPPFSTQCERRHTPPPQEQLHGHHDHDDLLLALRWLCQECHKAVHRENSKQNTD